MAHLKKPSAILKITLVLYREKREIYKENRGFDESSSVRETNWNEVIELIKSLNTNKTCQNIDIITKIIKLNADVLAKYILGNFNYYLEKDGIPCVL